MGESEMLLQNLNDGECRELLTRMGFGRLGCASENQPYVVPIYFACHDEYLYGFSTVGQKIAWMRTNPLICIEVDEVIAPENWSSVIVFGLYEEMPDTPRYAHLRQFAHDLVDKRELWWEPAVASAQTRPEEIRPAPILYRLKINKMTGHKAVPN